MVVTVAALPTNLITGYERLSFDVKSLPCDTVTLTQWLIGWTDMHMSQVKLVHETIMKLNVQTWDQHI